MEMSSLPVELTVIWNGDFTIDNPTHNKGEQILRNTCPHMPDSSKSISAHCSDIIQWTETLTLYKDTMDTNARKPLLPVIALGLHSNGQMVCLR